MTWRLKNVHIVNNHKMNVSVLWKMNQMSSEDEEIVEDEEVISGESDPEFVTEVTPEDVIEDSTSANDQEIEKLKDDMQLSGEEDVVGSGESIMVKNNIPDKPDEEREKQLLKELFPNVYKRKYPDEA